MRRREFVTLLAAAWPATAGAQQRQLPRIGILTPAQSDQTPIFRAFRQGLAELGYDEGRNVIIEFRSARGDSALLPALAAELVSMPVDVILTDGAAAARAAQYATKRIPIVMGASGIDPVPLGFAESLRRPGGNLTGFTLLHRQLNEKRVDLIRTLLPHATALTVLVNPVPGAELAVATIQESARSLGMAIIRIDAATPAVLQALRPEHLLEKGNAPVMIVPDAMFWNNRETLVVLVNAARLPALYPA